MKTPTYRRIRRMVNGENDGASAFRNCWCPAYDECMQKAVKDDLLLDCQRCTLKAQRPETFTLTIEEIEGCRCLLEAVFFNKRQQGRPQPGHGAE